MLGNIITESLKLNKKIYRLLKQIYTNFGARYWQLPRL